ncbi:hypothetical protein FO519_003878 [Halicephalobus sp. NKZ332]|nr:hypothetical protein FO519_003878 [Halicephalobus sp. NKZ332]
MLTRESSTDSMNSLIVSVKKARLQGSLEDFQSYVTVKLQNVKSTTVAVRGRNPCWEQEFIFETNRLDQGLMVELWNKGVLWDKLIGVHYMPLYSVQYSDIPGPGKWVQIDQDLETRNGQTVGTCNPTGHSVLVDVRFELPFDAQAGDVQQLQAKLQSLNQLEDHPDHQGMVPQHRAPFHSGISEDSDYTSDVSFPIHHQQNSSTHQWDSHLHPNRSKNSQSHITNDFQASYEDEEDAYRRKNEDEFEENEDTEREMDQRPSGSSYRYEGRVDDEPIDDYERNQEEYEGNQDYYSPPRAYAHERTGFQVDHRNYDRESDEYDAEMEDYLPPGSSGQQTRRYYDSEGDYQPPTSQKHYDSESDYQPQTSQKHYDSESDYQPQTSQKHYDSESDYQPQTSQRHYDSRSNSSATVERKYDSESEGGYARDGYRYDSSEYPSTVEERYPSKIKLNDENIDYSARLAELERRYDSKQNEAYSNPDHNALDEPGTSTNNFDLENRNNPRNRYLAEEGFQTPTPTEEVQSKFVDEPEYDHYENEGYIDPIDVKQPSEYEPLSYNSRPPGNISRRQSSTSGRFEEGIKTPEEMKEDSNIQTKHVNGFLPNGYGQMSNHSIASSQGSGQNSIFPTMQRRTSDSAESRTQSGPIFEQVSNRRMSENQYDVPSTIMEEPHDYEKEYAVYNDLPNKLEPEKQRPPGVAFSPVVEELQEIQEENEQVQEERLQEKTLEPTVRRDYKDLWRKAYRSTCKELGREVGGVFDDIFNGVWVKFST